MATSSALFPALLTASILLTLSISSSTPNPTLQTLCKDPNNTSIHQELQELKLKVSKLESILEESIQSFNIKVHYIEEKGKLIEEISRKIDSLQTSLSDIKGESTYTEERINMLEEQVRLLWAASRKNNFDIHILESDAQDADTRLEALLSKVGKMENVVTEQWIQIRQLDQALLVTEMRTSRPLRRAGLTRCTFLKFINCLSEHHLPRLIGAVEQRLFGKGSVISSYMHQALDLLKKIMLSAKRYHLELQAFIRQEMERNEFTAAVANQELVFVVCGVLGCFCYPILAEQEPYSVNILKLCGGTEFSYLILVHSQNRYSVISFAYLLAAFHLPVEEDEVQNFLGTNVSSKKRINDMMDAAKHRVC